MQLTQVFKRFTERSKIPVVPEKKKFVFQRSFKLALLSGLVHILPISISITLVTLNLRGTYIGPSLGSDIWLTTWTLALLQFAAKLFVNY